jgi:hypothetical protein
VPSDALDAGADFVRACARRHGVKPTGLDVARGYVERLDEKKLRLRGSLVLAVIVIGGMALELSLPAREADRATARLPPLYCGPFRLRRKKWPVEPKRSSAAN